jgi:hypothetical protein
VIRISFDLFEFVHDVLSMVLCFILSLCTICNYRFVRYVMLFWIFCHRYTVTIGLIFFVIITIIIITVINFLYHLLCERIIYVTVDCISSPSLTTTHRWPQTRVFKLAKVQVYQSLILIDTDVISARSCISMYYCVHTNRVYSFEISTAQSDNFEFMLETQETVTRQGEHPWLQWSRR